MTIGSYARQTSDMITFLNEIKEHHKEDIRTVPEAAAWLADVERDHEVFLAATVKKTQLEREQLEILSATVTREPLTESIDILLLKLQILDNEARLRKKPLEKLSELISDIATLIQNTERDIAAEKSTTAETETTTTSTDSDDS